MLFLFFIQKCFFNTFLTVIQYFYLFIFFIVLQITRTFFFLKCHFLLSANPTQYNTYSNLNVSTTYTLITMTPNIYIMGVICMLDCILPQSICLPVWDASLQEAFLLKVIWLAWTNGKQVEVTVLLILGMVAQACEHIKTELYMLSE